MTRLLLAALLLFALPCAAMAQDDGDPREAAAYRRAEQIVDVIKGTMKPGDVFSPAFLKAIPAEQLHAIMAGLVTANGAARTIDKLVYRGDGAAGFEVLFERARVNAFLQVGEEDPFLIAGFSITDATPMGENTDARSAADHTE